MMNLSIDLFYLILIYLTIPYLPIINKLSFKPILVRLYLTIKLLSGLLLWLIYEFHYSNRNSSDIFKYFDDSLILYNSFFSNRIDFFKMLIGFGNNDSSLVVYYSQMNNWYHHSQNFFFNDYHIMIRLNAFLRFFSFGNYFVHFLFFNLLSTIGTAGILRFIQKNLIDNSNRQLLYTVILIPSFLFWTSGILKEALVTFLIGLCLYSSENLFFYKRRQLHLFSIAFSIILLFTIKSYVALALTIALLPYYWAQQNNLLLVIKKYVAIIIGFVISILTLHFIGPQIDPINIVLQKQEQFSAIGKSQNATSTFKINLINNNMLSVTKSILLSFRNNFNVNLNYNQNVLLLLSRLENIFILSLCILALFIIKPLHKINYNFLFMQITFSIIIIIITGSVTTIEGALVRYKCICLPFLLSSLIAIIDIDKLDFFWTKKSIPFAIKKNKISTN